MATIRKRKNSWQVQIRKDGKKSFNKSFKTKAHALAWARKIESEIERGLISPAYGIESVSTLRDLIERYRDTFTPRKRSCIEETYRLNRLRENPLASKRASQITSEDIAKYRDLRLSDVGSQAVRHDLNILSQIFSVAEKEWGLRLDKHPLEGVWKPPISKSRQRRLCKDELISIRKFLSQPKERELSDLISFALDTAMRKGEILRVQTSHINFQKLTLLIPETVRHQSIWNRRVDKLSECLAHLGVRHQHQWDSLG